jgi:hypothetical protein
MTRKLLLCLVFVEVLLVVLAVVSFAFVSGGVPPPRPPRPAPFYPELFLGRALVSGSFSVPRWLWAPVGFRHPRDFRGPRRLSETISSCFAVGAVAVLTAHVLAVFVWRLYENCLKSPPGTITGLWVDLPTELPGSVAADNEFGLPPPGGLNYWPGGRQVSISCVAAAQRLRRRARWVRALEKVLGGRTGVVASFVRGRWLPDLPSSDRCLDANYLLGTIPTGARCLGGGVTQGKRPELDDVHIYLVLDLEGECVLVYPELLGKLRMYSLFRKRDDALLGALRSRAVEWARDRLYNPVADMAVASAVACAMLPSSHEISSQVLVQRAQNFAPPPHASL